MQQSGLKFPQQIAGARPIEVVALMRSPEADRALREVLGEVKELRLRSATGALVQGASTLVSGHAPDLLLLDLDPSDEAEVAALESLVRGQSGQAAILVTAAAPTVEGMRRLMRLGITDLVPQPIRRADLLSAIGAALGSRQRAGDRQSGEVVCFMKAGGGAGATTLAVQSACALARKARKDKTKDADIALVDLDLQFGSAALHLDLAPKASFLEVLATPERLDGTLLRSVALRHASGLELLPAPNLMQPLEAVRAEAVAALLAVARQEYRAVMVDMPQCWTAWSRAALASADAIVLALQPTLPSVRHARRQIDTLAEEGLDHIPLLLVANRVRKTLFGWRGVPMKEIQQVLERPVGHVVAEDDKAVADALDRGIPLWQASGGRRSAKRIAALAEQALARAAAARNAQTAT